MGGTHLNKQRVFSADPGLNINIPNEANELFFLKLMLTDDVIENITKETNFYAGNYIVDKSAVEQLAPAATSRLWPGGGITVNRMWIFMALQYYMELVKKYKRLLCDREHYVYSFKFHV